jgi:hypothetical protein
MKTKEQTKLDHSQIDDVVVEGINHNDCPDFCDAYIASAMYNDPITGNYRGLTENELENLNSDWIYEQIENWIH